MSQLGFLLRDKALSQSREGRTERINMVRQFLWGPEAQVAVLLGKERFLTADDVQDAVDVLFPDESAKDKKERRWTASVLVGWSLVKCTETFVTSRRSQNHGRKIPRWVWV